METNENMRLAGSRLRQPTTKIPLSPNRSLMEMSSSESNTRSQMPPPQPHFQGTKHKPPGMAEPPAKRETLADRAGRPVQASHIAPPSTRGLNDSIRSSANSYRGPPPSAHSRSVSAASSRMTSGSSSFSSSVGYGSRPPSSLRSSRPQNHLSHSRSQSHTSHNNFRPGSSSSNYTQHNGSFAPANKAFEPDLEMDSTWTKQFEHIKDTISKHNAGEEDRKEVIRLYKTRIAELETSRTELSSANTKLTESLHELKGELLTANHELNGAKRSHSFDMDDLRRRTEREVEALNEKFQRELRLEKERTEKVAEKVTKDFEEQLEHMEKAHKELLHDQERQIRGELEEERNKRSREIQELAAQSTLRLQETSQDLERKAREADDVRRERDETAAALQREKSLRTSLEDKLTEASANNMTLETANRAMKAKIDFLESDNQAQSNSFADLHRLKQEAEEAMNVALEKLRTEETLRRKLHNQVQELKGNIRVMCRVRPASDSEAEDAAKIAFPDAELDCKEVTVQGPEKTSALGVVTTSNNAFSFDRVFAPASHNAEIFEEISQLVQSALDGYNVCIFCYGQTGSGKTFTMSSVDGMIPRATAQIYSEAQRLAEKGWTYKMEGSFVEVYNENLNDLLGKAEELDKKKLEIRHDLQKKTTTITDITTVELDSADRVEEIMQRAAANRTVAATKANSRSSRSHSVFILKLIGENSMTGERSEGTLNLVDLAGSERLAHSQAAGDRLKETQNINKSLSCLGDVIGALGQGKEGTHIPYRNSKLTYLLQNSLGGNSKTLMFVMISPLQAHLSETLTSLKFATKVHNTHIGTAKKQSKVKE